MSKKAIYVGLSFLVFLAASAADARPQEEAEKTPAGEAADAESATPEPSRGAVIFRLYCASCHGPEGHGDGPVAEVLKSPPPDLTRLAQRRAGRFPKIEIERIIDGRLEVEVHGSGEMPVWGLSFRQPERIDDQEEEVYLQIQHLVRHLRSIQVGKVVDEN